MRHALLAFALGGCSWIFVPRAPSPSALRVPECATAAASPTVDVVWAALYAVLATAIVIDLAGSREVCDCPDNSFDPCTNCRSVSEGAGSLLAAAALFGSPAVVHGFSARYGFAQLDRCREARDPTHDAGSSLTAEDSANAPLPREGEECRGPCQRGLVCRGHRCVPIGPERAKLPLAADFAAFVARTYPGAPPDGEGETHRCELMVGDDGYAVAGTIREGSEVVDLVAVFEPGAGGAWTCDHARSRARARQSGRDYNACILLDEACGAR